MARIALDIDSTLHHYWDLLERIAQERYGVALPYAQQSDWGITALERDQLIAVVEETHSDENIENAEPYEGAVEAVRRWHEAGHWIHVTSHRRTSCDPATRRWLESTGIPYAEQSGWGITALERDQLIAVVEETHSDENIENAEPY